MDVPQLIGALLVSAFTGGFVTELTKSVIARIRGRSTRRTELEQAWERADDESRKRRVVEEHASHLRRLLLSADCIDATTIPAFPSYGKRDT